MVQSCNAPLFVRQEDFEKYQPKDFSALVSASGD